MSHNLIFMIRCYDDYMFLKNQHKAQIKKKNNKKKKVAYPFQLLDLSIIY